MTLTEVVSVSLGPARKIGTLLPLTIQAGDLWGQVGRSLAGEFCSETSTMTMAMAKDELTTGSARREGSLPSLEGVATPHAHLARWTVAWFVCFIWGRRAVVFESLFCLGSSGCEVDLALFLSLLKVHRH